jgi:hypothetical protein
MLPLRTRLIFQQIALHGLLGKGRRLHAQQPDFRAFAPVCVEQAMNFAEDFIVELGWRVQAMRAGNGREILVAQLELQGACVELLFAQPPSHHLR